MYISEPDPKVDLTSVYSDEIVGINEEMLEYLINERPIKVDQQEHALMSQKVLAETYQEKAKRITRNWIDKYLDKSDPEVEYEVFVVWFSKTLQNWKCMVSTTLPDQMYYEITYNGDKKETYFDAYKKWDNMAVPDDDA